MLLVAAALAVGALVGLVSGLSGIGGGVLMVPFLYVVYARLGVARADATAMAHATSLAVIVPTEVLFTEFSVSENVASSSAGSNSFKTSLSGIVTLSTTDVFVPSDREIPRTVNEGVAIVTALPRSEAAEAFKLLASFYSARLPEAGELEPLAGGESRGSRMFRRRAG